MAANMRIIRTKLKCKKTKQQLRRILGTIARKTNDKPYEDQPHQNLICPDLYAIEYDADIDDSTNGNELLEKYGNSKTKKEIQWPNDHWRENRVPECGYRMCPSVIKISINQNAIFQNNETGEMDYNEFDPQSYNISFISKVFGISHLSSYIVGKDGNRIYFHLSNLLCQIYPYICHILKLSKLGINETRLLQIIVKAQVYNIEFFKNFSGKHHMDGALERVMCGIAWYYKIDKELSGGDLIFQAINNDGCVYVAGKDGQKGEYIDEQIEYFDERSNNVAKTQKYSEAEIQKLNGYRPTNNYKHVEIEENDIILWNQQGLVHRVGDITTKLSEKTTYRERQDTYKKMKKEKEKKGESLPCYQRGFLNFFIIDPTFALPRTSLNVPNPIDPSGKIKMKIVNFLQVNIDKYIFNNKHMTPMVLCNIIYEMGFPKSRSLSQSKKIRKQIVKHRMDKNGMDEKYVHQGNEGTYMFFWDWENRSDDGYC